MINPPKTYARKKRIDVQFLAIGIFVVLFVVAIAFFVNHTIKTRELAHYTSEKYGFSFDYPKRYALNEATMTNGSNDIGAAITLIENGVHIIENGEGPTAITIAIYDNAASNVQGENPLDFWIEKSPYSNITLAKTPKTATTTVNGREARTYIWDGLYQGTSVVTEYTGDIIMASVTYDGKGDTKKQNDFKRLMDTFIFSTSTAQ